ncbi:MAG: hemerythrin domain-containing protein [Burkholderiaceae bacterium]
MESIVSLLSKDHSHCDDLFFQAESNVSKSRWELAIVMYKKFKVALERHLAIEEEILFPAMGDASGNTCGPTAVMRSEHQQIRQIIQDLDSAVNTRDAKEFLGNSETLNIMMQQHNFKEEHMLYVMADQQLAGRREEIITAMEGIKELA